MARTADKPGTYRIRPKGNGYVLSGVKLDGTRLRLPTTNEYEAMHLAGTLFPGGTKSVPKPTIPEITAPFDNGSDWSFDLPTVTTESAQSVASAMGIPPTPAPAPTVTEQDKKIAEVQANRKKAAKSLTELLGHGYAMGIVMGSQRLVTSAGKVPVKPSPKQVSDLAESTKDTITEWFGDHEVKPWIMMILLSIGIPLSMYIQSPKAPKKELTEEGQSPALRSVT